MQYAVNQIQVFYKLDVRTGKGDELKKIASKIVTMNATDCGFEPEYINRVDGYVQ